MKKELRSIAIVCGLLAVSLPARAAVLNVAASLVDVNADGQCSLREAMENAAANSTTHADCPPTGGYGADVINLTASTYNAADGPYSGDGDNAFPAVTGNLTIHGNGATVQRDPQAMDDFRLFAVTDPGTLNIDHLTVTNGRATAGSLGSRGGALLNEWGTLNLDSVSVTNSFASDGGGGIGTAGTTTTTIVNSTLSGNSAGSGGGIYNGETHHLVLNGSTVDDNSASIGGGITSYGDTELTCTTVSNNDASYGGGIYAATTATTSIANSAILNNSANEDSGSDGIGGGIYNEGISNFQTVGTEGLVVVNSTIAGNSADTDGGGIFNSSGNVFLYNATVASNVADDDMNGTGDGGGIAENGSFLQQGVPLLFPAQVRFRNTSLADNIDRGQEAPDCIDLQTSPLSTNLNSEGYNLIENVQNCTITEAANSGTNVTGVDPNLGAPALPASPCDTAVACPASPSDAIDGGNPDGCRGADGTILSDDQREFVRPVDGGSGVVRCDIGACEFGSQLPPPEANPTPVMDGRVIAVLVLVLFGYVAWRGRFGTI